VFYESHHETGVIALPKWHYFDRMAEAQRSEDFMAGTIVGESFRYAVLERADFSAQDLTNADFQGATLVGCNFRGANLRYANFTGVRSEDLETCDFTGADLEKTLLEQGLNDFPDESRPLRAFRVSLTRTQEETITVMARTADHAEEVAIEEMGDSWEVEYAIAVKPKAATPGV
jgi:hypothetical protein